MAHTELHCAVGTVAVMEGALVSVADWTKVVEEKKVVLVLWRSQNLFAAKGVGAAWLGQLLGWLAQA